EGDGPPGSGAAAEKVILQSTLAAPESRAEERDSDEVQRDNTQIQRTHGNWRILARGGLARCWLRKKRRLESRRHITPSVSGCEKLARQAKPPAPPTLQILAQQGRWGRRFRLPGRRNQFFTPSHAWGYVEIVAARSEDNGQ